MTPVKRPFAVVGLIPGSFSKTNIIAPPLCRTLPYPCTSLVRGVMTIMTSCKIMNGMLYPRKWPKRMKRHILTNTTQADHCYLQQHPNIMFARQDQSGWHKPLHPLEKQDKCSGRALIKGLAVLRFWLKSCSPFILPVEIGVQTLHCLHWPENLVRSSLQIAHETQKQFFWCIMGRRVQCFICTFWTYVKYFSGKTKYSKLLDKILSSKYVDPTTLALNLYLFNQMGLI